MQRGYNFIFGYSVLMPIFFKIQVALKKKKNRV